MVFDADGDDVRRRLAALLDLAVGPGERHAGRRRDLAGHPEHAQQIRAVRLDLDVEDGVVQAQDRLHVVADRDVLCVEKQDPAVVLADRELHRRAEHPGRVDPADGLDRERLAEGRDAGSGRGPRDEVTLAHVPDPDHQLGLAGGVLDPGDAELVGVRMVADLDDLRDDDALQAAPWSLDRLDQHPARDQHLRERLRLEFARGELAQPRQRDQHQTAPNCSRNRTSPSINSRMSGIEYCRSATRSTPNPNANPV